MTPGPSKKPAEFANGKRLGAEVNDPRDQSNLYYSTTHISCLHSTHIDSRHERVLKTRKDEVISRRGSSTSRARFTADIRRGDPSIL